LATWSVRSTAALPGGAHVNRGGTRMKNESETMKQDLGAKISVCLLAYNHVELIESTMRSILSQTIDGYEVLVSDDQSDDGTWERILALAPEDPRIRPVRTPRNLGMAANANFAVEHTTRPYIALLHHDDLYRSDLLEKWAGVFERNPDVLFVFNYYGRYGRADMYTQPLVGERIDGRFFFQYMLRFWGCPVRGTAMIRRSAWDRLGGMREQFGLLADIDLWMRLSRLGAVGYVHEPIITVRQNRPDYYPSIYKAEGWSWDRQRILYEIHAVNRLETMARTSLADRLRWWVFRYRLSVETLWWLVYAVVKRKRTLIASCHRGETPYDLPVLGILRRLLQSTILGIGARGEDENSPASGDPG
jgi:glycosyltransferase involved in cell wall biosynthesis